MKYLGKQSIFDDLMIGGVLLSPPDPATYSYELTLPNDDGSAGQVLTTDGNGLLTWTTVGGTTSNALTIGTGLDLASGNTTWNGSAAETLNLDLTEVITTDANNKVLTSNGNGTLTAEANLQWLATALTIGGENTTTNYITRAQNTTGNGGGLRINGGTGIGTNLAGGDLILAGGGATGSGAGGDIKFLTIHQVGSSGTALNVTSDETLVLSGTNAHLGEDVTLSFEGATDNGYETTLTVVDPTADRTITFPDTTGTVALTSDIPALSVPVTVAQGGTGLTTVGSDQILTGNGTGALTSEADLRFYGGDTLAIGSNTDAGTDNIQRSPAGIDIDGGSLDIEAGNTRPGAGTNRNGGDLNLKPGLSTGTGVSGKLNIYTGWEGVSGTGQLGPAIHSTINSVAAANYFTIYEPNVATTDFFRTTVVGGGATTLATFDGSGSQTGSLVLDVDGLIDIDAARNGLIRFMVAGTQYGEVTAAGSKSSIYLYEAAGASTDDWFRIETDTHGATEIATKDNTGANAADLTLTIEGDIELNADGGDINFKDGTAQLARISSDGLSFRDNLGAKIVFEGSTDDANLTSLEVTDPTGTRTITLPDATGTVALTSDITNTTISGTTANGIATYGGANQIDIESSLTYDSNTLSHNGNFTIDVGNELTIDVDSGILNIKDAGVQKVKLGSSGLDFTDNTAAEITFEGSTDDAHKTVINVTDPTGSRTCTFPDASGTVALVENTARHTVSLRTDDAYVMYLGNVNRWYHANRVFSSIGTQSTLDGASVVDSIAISSASYIATRPCTVHSIVVSWYPSQTCNVEFEILKVPLVDNSTLNVTFAQMTHTNHDGSYTANTNYVKTFAITGGNTLTAGQGIAFCARRTSGSNAYMNGGQIYAEIEITG